MNLLNKISMNYLPKVDANKCDFFILTTISLRQVFFFTTAILLHCRKNGVYLSFWGEWDYTRRDSIVRSRFAFEEIMKKVLFFVVFIFARIFDASGAENTLGIPPIVNFSKKAYAAGTQNWDIAQDSRGVMYFANNNGLLRFDGVVWSCFKVSNGTIVRSLAIHSSGRIYVGAQGEFGYFFPGANGGLQYHSLINLLSKDFRNFEDIWDISFHDGAVFFRSNQAVFQFLGEQIKIHKVRAGINGMFPCRSHLYLLDNAFQMYQFKQGVFEPTVGRTPFQSAITAMIPWKNDSVLCCTLKDGIFSLHQDRLVRWQTSVDGALAEKRVYAGTILPNNQMALATSLDGLVILDENRLVAKQLTKRNGLQNNNILSTFLDRRGNIWLGLDNGIDCVNLSSPFSTIIPDRELISTGYSARIFNQQLFLGLSDGIYSTPWTSDLTHKGVTSMRKIPGLDGQVWKVDDRSGKLLVGHHEGTFQLDGDRPTKISSEAGAWTFVQMTADYLLGGTYNGLVLYKKSSQGWQVDQKLEGLKESCRIMVKDEDGAIWVSHPYRGVYRILWRPERKAELQVSFFDKRNGLPTNLNNYVFQVAQKAVFATEKGVYRFNKKTQTFYLDADFNKLLGAEHRIKSLQEDQKGNIWFVSDLEVGVLLVDDFGLRKESKKKVFSELSNKLVGGFEFIYPYDSKNIFFGAEQGFIHYNAENLYKEDSLLDLIVTKVEAAGQKDSVLFDGWFVSRGNAYVLQRADESCQVAASTNNLNFSYSAMPYTEMATIQYRTQLVGFDKDWTAWADGTSRNYTNLPSGTYVFQVQAGSADGKLSSIVKYSFRIQPPWYASKLAFFVYFLVLVGLIFGFLRRQKSKFEKEKETIIVQHQEREEQHLMQVEATKAALVQTLNEKLENEITFKNKELASATLHLVQKGEIPLSVQSALNQLLEKSTNGEVKKEIQGLINLLSFDSNLDTDWQQFTYHFDQVHVDFLERLRKQFPQLTPNDEKLCAYLRLNLSTKETAQLLNISVRGVEASRFWLRKKLNLSNEANLVEFMLKV